jgi:uncharacterized protein YecE (DUF72 family)
VRGEIFRLFLAGVEPLRAAGRLGGILLQLAPYVVYRERSLEYLEWAREQLAGLDVLVEFRHRSWLDDEHRRDTLAFLEHHGLTNVIVDAPRSEAKNLIPTVVALTSGTAYVRMHGRNSATWNVRGGSASDRFDYLYSEDELREWVQPLRQLSDEAEEAYVVFNNNRWSPSADDPHRQLAQAPQNAQRLAALLADAGVPV